MPQHDMSHKDRLAARMRADMADKAVRDEAVRVVERWKTHIAFDSDMRCSWSTIIVAVVTGIPWPDVYCPVCKTTRAIDIHEDRNPTRRAAARGVRAALAECPR